jgi:hypothetical protein
MAYRQDLENLAIPLKSSGSGGRGIQANNSQHETCSCNFEAMRKVLKKDTFPPAKRSDFAALSRGALVLRGQKW